MKKIFNRIKTIVVFYVLILFASSIPLTSSADMEPIEGGTLIIVVSGSFDTLNPALSSTLHSGAVSAQIFGPLLDHDFEMNPQPYLAKSWEWSENGLQLTLHLVENAKWHDGVPFTSKDIKYMFSEEVFENAPRMANVYRAVTSVDTPDDYTAVLNLEYPDAGLIYMLSTYGDGNPLPEHIYKGTDFKNNPANENPIGLGPFKLEEWVKGSHITLVKNEDFFMPGKPHLDKIIYKIIQDPVTRRTAFLKREFDWYPNSIPFSDLPDLEENPDITVTTKGGEAFPSTDPNLIFNLREPPFDDINVRKAIAHALDTEKIAQLVASGYTKASVAPIAAYSWTHNPNLPQYDYNVDKANQLLDDAGYTKGSDGIRFKTSVLYDIGETEYVKTAEIMKEMLKDVGIELELIGLERTAWIEELFVNWNFELALRTCGLGPWPTAGAFYRSLFSGNIKKVGWHNAMGYDNPRVDELFGLMAPTSDKTKLKEYMYEVQEIVWDELPMFAIYDIARYQAYYSDVKGIPDGPWVMRSPLEEVQFMEEVEEPTPSTFPTNYLLAGVVVIVAIIAIYWYRKQT
jgi:peptide/nickel transport system substrate-binding protein